MNIVKQVAESFFPNRFDVCNIKYTGKCKGYNANIKVRGSEVLVTASREWQTVSLEIQRGLVEELLLRVTKKNIKTLNRELYHNFIKSLPNYAPKTSTHPILEKSFERVNSLFFENGMESPNLRIGSGINRLGTYEYATNTVTISKILLEHNDLLDYVMYHELLHKKHQYTMGKRCSHHSVKFREDEKKFPNAETLEKELQHLVSKNKRRSWFFR